MRIAIIGAGISGLGAAWLLHKAHDISVYEAQPRLGGHSHTLTIDYDGEQIPVDAGFVVYNNQNYPNLKALFKQLHVATEPSDMSFAVSTANGAIEWGSDNLNTLFAQRRNLFSARFLSTLLHIRRFNQIAPIDLANGVLAGRTLGEYLDHRNFSDSFRSHYLFPMGGAIWSMPLQGMNNFPAESFVAFCRNHYLMAQKCPRWRTVSGGSHEYVNKITAPFTRKIRKATAVTKITRRAGQVRVCDATGGEDVFDHVIVAAHADQTLAMLGDASAQERHILGAFLYAPNTAYVHRDPALMPRLKQVWSSWNYLSCDNVQPAVSVSYWMNRLQNIPHNQPLFITLNALQAPRPELTFAEIQFAHVQYDLPALHAQRALADIQGSGNIWYCGAWTGHGFHEDGLASGLAIAERIGKCVRPWDIAAITSQAA